MRTVTLTHESSIGRSAFLTRLCDISLWESLGSRARVERQDVDTEVLVRTPVATSDLPAAVASRLAGDAELEETYLLPGEVAGASTEVRMSARAAGVPVEIDALISVGDTESGSSVSVRAEISSSVPIFGAMVESAIAPVLERTLARRLSVFAAD